MKIVGSTFLNNTGGSFGEQIWFGAGTAIIENTVVWGPSTGLMLGNQSGTTLTMNHCLVKGQTLTGTGNLAGNVDPRLRSDGHLLWDSPLREAGGSTTQSRIDIDGETRPSTSPDIGVDQFNDTDADQLADAWEMANAGDLTTLTGLFQDADSDGLTNDDEYVNRTHPMMSDTDGDGISDGDEMNVYGSDPLSVDTDGDEMPDGWETTYGLSPTVANGFDDADGDRYPNIFEYVRSSDPNDRSNIPTPNYTVDAAGGGTHTTVSAAISASNIANGAYQIIGIAPGVYTGAPNLNGVNLETSKPKFLIIGLEGADKTIIDGGGTSNGWSISNTAVVASLTFQKTTRALYFVTPWKEVRLVDLLVRDNGGGQTAFAGGVHVINSYPINLKIVGSTFLNNTGGSFGEQIWLGEGTATLENTVVWGTSSGLMLGNRSGTTLSANHCLVKGQTLTGTGNLVGNADPKLLSDGHLLWDSPLREAGGPTMQSRIDIDGELRPNTSPDIGVDQFNDTDADQLADGWELASAGDLTTLTGRFQDADNDGLTNDVEYVNRTNPMMSDTDGDGVSDGDEMNVYGSNPLSVDTDGDEMPDGWEIGHGLSATVANAFDDDDGDRYPNIFEYVRMSDPSDRLSIPTPNYTVDAAGGGTHTTVGAAISASNIINGAYQIIGIAPGVYTGSSNLNGVSLDTSKPKLLIIGLEGAGKTIIDGEGANNGWSISNSAVVASLTFQKTTRALYFVTAWKEVRLVDLLIRDNVASTSYAAGVHVTTSYPVNLKIVGSTFLNNTGGSFGEQIWLGEGTAAIVNTLVWGASSGLMLANRTGTTLTTSHCLVKGQTLSGAGNLDGTVDPKLRSDVHLRSDSPLRGAGVSITQSRIDIDGELRPSSALDIGVDQFVDSDADELPDNWELATVGDLTTLDGLDDEDGDGLDNSSEYDFETDYLNPDTDGDGIDDGLEIELGTNPRVADSDDLSGDLNHDGVIDSIDVQLGHLLNEMDTDGDGVSNTDERLMCTDPLRSDTDGDGVSDSLDAFPHDPLTSTLPSDPEDTTPPVITLIRPWYAVEQ